FIYSQAADGKRYSLVTGVHTCALPICPGALLLARARLPTGEPAKGTCLERPSVGEHGRVEERLDEGGAVEPGRVGGRHPGRADRSEERRVGKEGRWGCWSET